MVAQPDVVEGDRVRVLSPYSNLRQGETLEAVKPDDPYWEFYGPAIRKPEMGARDWLLHKYEYRIEPRDPSWER